MDEPARVSKRVTTERLIIAWLKNRSTRLQSLKWFLPKSKVAAFVAVALGTSSKCQELQRPQHYADFVSWS